MLSTVFNPCSNIHLVIFFRIGMKGDGLLYIKKILQVTTRYFFCLLLKKLLTYFLSSTVCTVLRWLDRSVVHCSDVYKGSGVMFRTFAQFLFNFFSEGQGVWKILLEIQDGRGVYFSSQKWKFRRGGGS